jgi:hypothetical protein
MARKVSDEFTLLRCRIYHQANYRFGGEAANHYGEPNSTVTVLDGTKPR